MPELDFSPAEARMREYVKGYAEATGRTVAECVDYAAKLVAHFRPAETRAELIENAAEEAAWWNAQANTTRPTGRVQRPPITGVRRSRSRSSHSSRPGHRRTATTRGGDSGDDSPAPPPVAEPLAARSAVPSAVAVAA